MKYKATESVEFEKPLIPEGLYPARFVGDQEGPEGEYGPRVIADFEVFYDKDKKSVKIGRFYGLKKDGSVAKKGNYFKALVAMGLKENVTDIDTDAMKGHPCRVLVKNYKDNDGKDVSGINDVMAPAPDTLPFIQEHEKRHNLTGAKIPEETVR